MYLKINPFVTVQGQGREVIDQDSYLIHSWWILNMTTRATYEKYASRFPNVVVVLLLRVFQFPVKHSRPYNKNEYKARRVNRGELVLEWKSYRCHVHTAFVVVNILSANRASFN